MPTYTIRTHRSAAFQIATDATVPEMKAALRPGVELVEPERVHVVEPDAAAKPAEKAPRKPRKAREATAETVILASRLITFMRRGEAGYAYPLDALTVGLDAHRDDVKRAIDYLGAQIITSGEGRAKRYALAPAANGATQTATNAGGAA